MKLRDIMTSNVCCASPSDSIADVASEMKRHNVGIMPVCDGDKLIGVITDRDIAIGWAASGSNARETKVSSFMSSNPMCGSPDMDVSEAVRLMGDEQVHRLPVTEGDRLVGIVSLGDLAVHSSDDKIVAQLVRDLSTPVRSQKPEALAA